jgi:hypothetical protein
VGRRNSLSYRFAQCQDYKKSDAEPEIVESISPLPLVKVVLGKGGSNKIYGHLFRRRTFLSGEKEGVPSKSFFLDGTTSKKAVAQPDKTLLERKHGIFDSKGKWVSLLSPPGFRFI